jgi:flagellar hook-associated protein 2
MSLSFASNTTKSGAYDVVLSQSASQATDTGTVLSTGAVSSGEQLTVNSGAASIPYTTTAGQTLTSVASGLNQAFAAAGVSLSAQVTDNGQQLQLLSDDYGSATAFSVATTGGGTGSTGLAGTFSGTDVAGTIGGVAATGIGQFLSAPVSDPALAGLSVRITTTGITSPTDLGQFSYVPGIAQSLATLGSAMASSGTGAVTQTIKGLQAQSLGLNSQIAMYARIVSQEQTLLTNQYATLDATMSTLTNQGTSLTAQLAQISANSSSSG